MLTAAISRLLADVSQAGCVSTELARTLNTEKNKSVHHNEVHNYLPCGLAIPGEHFSSHSVHVGNNGHSIPCC